MSATLIQVTARARPLAVILLAATCAGCVAPPTHTAIQWDGRRGYDGNGDYGYDVAASEAAASGFRSQATGRAYLVPGTPGDPWGPYVREAAARFQVPERWVREVMRQESGGQLYDSNGQLTTSQVGAMGLMQIMPQTYEPLRERYGLGNDPYDPHDNILAGAAYIHEMYARYGAPGFLAAYNAGPDRLDAYLQGAEPLPAETVGYLASVAPRLGNDIPLSGPLAAYATGTSPVIPLPAYASDADRAYAGGGMTGTDYQQSSRPPLEVADDPSLHAYAGGGMTGAEYQQSTPPPAPAPDNASLQAYSGGMTGPQYQQATVASPPPAPDDPSLRAYNGGGMTGPQYQHATAASPAPAPDDPSLRAYNGGGLVTPDSPTGQYEPEAQ